MNPLIEQFPKTVYVRDQEKAVHSDFRTILRCYEIAEKNTKGKHISPEGLIKMLSLFYEVPERMTEEHIDQMFWFMACGREKQKKHFPRKAAGINGNTPFDFEKDADLIYAGFYQQYRIDLQKSHMHWWKFMILLENLGEDTRLSRLIEYRTIDTSSKNLSKEARNFYKAMQKYYSLENNVEISDKQKAIEDALLKGENIDELLKNWGDED